MDGRYHAFGSTNRQTQATRLEEISGRFDEWLLASVIALLSVGLVMVASSSLQFAEQKNLELLYFFHRQAFAALLGVALMVFVMLRLDIRSLEKHAYILPLGCFLLLILVLLPGLGSSAKGAERWVRLGVITFQPAEVVKLLFVVWLASYLVRFSEQVKSSWRPVITVFGAASVLLVFSVQGQSDFGTPAMLLVIAAWMLLLGGIRLTRLMVPIIAVMPFMIMFIANSAYRKARIKAWINPWEYQQDEGYQLTTSFKAIGSGELWGVGLGGSVQKLSYLPEAHNDFIMAVLGEELGFVGICLLIGLYALLVWRGLRLGLQCMQARRHFSGYLCLGITGWIAIQSLISMGVNLGLLPTKGFTLPLISYGGSSILVTLVALGVLLRVSWELERAKRQKAVLHREMQQGWNGNEPLEKVGSQSKPLSGEKQVASPFAMLSGWFSALRLRKSRQPEKLRQRIEPSFGNGGQP